MAAASDSRERERRLRAQVAAPQSPTEQSSAPIFGAPVRVNQASDDISQTVKQVLGSVHAMDTSHFHTLIGIPKQPQTPTVESARSLPVDPWGGGRRPNGAHPPGHGHKRNGEMPSATGSSGSSSHPRHGGSSQKTTPTKSSSSGNPTEPRKSSHQKRREGGSSRGSSSKGGGSSSQRTSKGSRPSLDFSQLNGQSNLKESSKHDRTSSSAHGKHSTSHPAPKLSPLNAGAVPQAPRSGRHGLLVELPSDSLRDHEDLAGVAEEDMEAVMQIDDATRLARQSGDHTRPPPPLSRASGHGSKDKKVQDILRIYTEHSAPRPISAICTPIKENAPHFPFEEFPKKLEPIIDEPEEEEGYEEEVAEEHDDKRLKEDNSDEEDEEEEENSSCDKTQEDITLDSSVMAKEDGGDSSSGSEEDEGSQSSSEESEESESEDSGSNNRQARDPSPKPKEKSFSLQSQIQKVLNSKKFTQPTQQRISEKSNSSNVLPGLDIKKETLSPESGSQELQNDDRTDEADDEEDEIEVPRTPVKETKKPVSVGRGKTVPKSNRSSESRKGPGRPPSKGNSSQGDKASNIQGRGTPSSGTKSFDATKKGKESKPRVKPEKTPNVDDVGPTKKVRTPSSSSSKSLNAKPSNPKPKGKRGKSKKEEKFPSKAIITSSDSEDDGNNSGVAAPRERREPKQKNPPTPTEHRTSSNKGKSPLIRGGGSRKDPPKGPPQLSKIRETEQVSRGSEQARRGPQRGVLSSSEDEESHPVLSPVPSINREEADEAAAAAANVSPSLPMPSPPSDPLTHVMTPPTAVAVETPPTAPMDTGDLSSFAKGDIPHLVVSFDLALIKQLPVPRGEDRKTLFGPSKRKDLLDTEKPSAIVKPYHATSRKSSTNTRKEKISRTESRRPGTDSSSRSPRRMRDPPLPLTEQPPVIEPPILPSDPSRTLDRRRASSQSSDLSIRRGEHEPPPPKRSRSGHMDSHDGVPQQVGPGWSLGQPTHEEGPEGMFGAEERLGDGPLRRGAWEGEGFHQPGIYRNPPVRHDLSERQQFSSDDYLAEGKRLKRLADTQTDKYTQSLTYFEAALAFIMCGNNFENDTNYPDERAIRMYSDTCKIIKWLIGIHSGSDGRSNDKKLLVLCYRFQALLNMRMYTLKRAATTRLAKGLNDHFKSCKSSQQNQTSWNPSSKYSETPSPMSPTPSPVGSVGSVGSMGSQGSNNDIPPATTSSKVGPGLNGAGGTLVPQRIYNMMSTYMTNSTYCLASIDFWEQAESLAQENQDFFQEVHEHCGVLTLHSSILELVQYSKYCLHKLKEL